MVDDIIVTANNTKSPVEMTHFFLSEILKITDLCYLVIQLKCDDDCIEINMSKYVESLLNIFVMTVCENRSTERLYAIAVCTV